MRRVLFLLMLVPGILEAQEAARPAGGSVSGRWVVNTDFYGSTIYFRMELKQEGEKLTGDFDVEFCAEPGKRRQLEDAGRTTITGCNGKVHGWRLVEDERGVKRERFLSASQLTAKKARAFGPGFEV